MNWCLSTKLGFIQRFHPARYSSAQHPDPVWAVVASHSLALNYYDIRKVYVIRKINTHLI